MAEQFQRGLNTPPQHRPAPPPKGKARQASKGRPDKKRS
jgi:hypothetical protein